MTTFARDPSYRRFGAALLGGSPLRLFRLGRGGVRVAEAIERGAAPPAGHERLTDRLVDAGALHPVPDTRAAVPVGEVTIVVPARDALPDLRGLDGVAEVIVVDDASNPPLQAPPGVRMIRLEANVGPGRARDRGTAEVVTPFVAFVDTDVLLPDGWLAELLAHFADERVALVAPRIASAPGRGALGTYEELRSPLDLGPLRARVRAGTRVSYVPAAAVLCRRSALAAIGGFDPGLRTGEDVDLVWRLDEAGWRCRYEPAVVVHHRPRPTIRAWAAQRAAYGVSAAPLAIRHRGALAPVRMSAWSALVWALIAARRPVAAAAVAAGTSHALVRKLRDLPPAECWRLTLHGHLLAGRQLGNAVVRAWLPLAVAGVTWRRTRPVVLAAMLVPALVDWAAAPRRIDPLRYVAARLADDGAYAVGLWHGALRTRSTDALRPSFHPWPATPR